MLPHHLNSIYDERTQIIFCISDPILELMAELLEDHAATAEVGVARAASN